jgi:pimeloyl-ACP methyl ester carboxylesterase
MSVSSFVSSLDLGKTVPSSLEASSQSNTKQALFNSKSKNFRHSLLKNDNQIHFSRIQNLNLGQASDLAGNQKSSARQLGSLSDSQVYKFRDTIGTGDPNDFYTFTLDTRSNFGINALGLTKDVNLRLFSANGANLFQTKDSPQGSSSNIRYTQILNSGTYYVQFNKKTDNINYRLQLKPVSLTGDIENKGLSSLQNYPDLTYKDGVNFYHYDDRGRTDVGIDPNKNTIVVIHGRGSSSESSEIKALSLAAARQYDQKNYQVLVLDWKEPANDAALVPFTAARSIAPVAQWATKTLENLGLARNRITVLGHSLGSYVGAEIGQLYNGVKQFVALDPAFPAQQYDLDGNEPGDQRASSFQGVAKRSLSLVVQDAFLSQASLAGDNEQASTAQDSLLIKYDSSSNLGATKAHNTVISVFGNALSKQFLKLDDNLALPSLVSNVYTNFGKLVRQGGRHEGRIIATRDGSIKQLIYVDRSVGNQLNQTETWE